MILNIVLEDRQIAITVADEMLHDAQDFYAKMDRDMDQGWQMSRDWVEHPSLLERCQIAADKLHTALNTQNETLSGPSLLVARSNRRRVRAEILQPPNARDPMPVATPSFRHARARRLALSRLRPKI